MKKILIFSTAYLPLVGGAELAIKEITDRLGNKYEFDLICAKINSLQKRERIGVINVHRIGFGNILDKLLLPFFGFFKAIQLSRQNYYDLIWSISASYNSFAALFFKLHRANIPFVLTLQEGSSEKKRLTKVAFVRPLFNGIFKKADYIQAISNYLADFAKRMGVSCPIEVVPNGVDIEKVKSQKPASPAGGSKVKSIEELKSKLGIRPDEKVVITVSRLVPKNGIKDLIEAMSNVKCQMSNVKLLIAGSGPLEKELKQKVKNLGLQNKVLFLDEVLPGDVPKYLAVADIFVRPSLTEGLGNSFLEAMAAGLPIIGTSVGGIPDFLKEGETGLFCKVNDPKDLAKKLELLLTDQALYQKLKESGFKLVEEFYNWTIISNKMDRIFQRLI